MRVAWWVNGLTVESQITAYPSLFGPFLRPRLTHELGQKNEAGQGKFARFGREFNQTNKLDIAD